MENKGSFSFSQVRVGREAIQRKEGKGKGKFVPVLLFN
jgi:hypothetical protein